jgi:hypothetical protein
MARRSSGLPNVYPFLYNLGLTFFAVLFAVFTGIHHVWALTVVFGILSLWSAYATFTWIRGFARRRRTKGSRQ